MLISILLVRYTAYLDSKDSILNVASNHLKSVSSANQRWHPHPARNNLMLLEGWPTSSSQHIEHDAIAGSRPTQQNHRDLFINNFYAQQREWGTQHKTQRAKCARIFRRACFPAKFARALSAEIRAARAKQHHQNYSVFCVVFLRFTTFIGVHILLL